MTTNVNESEFNWQDESRFVRRVPDQFYESEKSKYGPLPSKWETGTKNGKTYFVDHQNKATTWIDPRSWDTRKHSVHDVIIGELPYGWDEDVDDEFGVYYINHLTQSNYADPPWDPVVREQVSLLEKFLDEQIQAGLRDMDNMDQRERDRVESAKGKLSELELERLRIENELLELRQKALAGDDESITSISEYSESISELSERLSEIEDEIDDVQPLTIPKDRDEFQRRLQELIALNEKLSKEKQPGFDGVGEYKKTEEEIRAVEDMLKKEEQGRLALEEEIMRLRREMEGALRDDDEPDESMEDVRELGSPDLDKPNRKHEMSRRTRYEMEMELLMLKKKLQAEKDERERLAALKDRIARGDQVGKVPVWLKQIDEVAQSSRTLRIKIGKQQTQNPDSLSFRERILFFTSGALEGGNIPKSKP